MMPKPTPALQRLLDAATDLWRIERVSQSPARDYLPALSALYPTGDLLDVALRMERGGGTGDGRAWLLTTDGQALAVRIIGEALVHPVPTGVAGGDGILFHNTIHGVRYATARQARYLARFAGDAPPFGPSERPTP